MVANRKTIPGLIENRKSFTNGSGTLKAFVNPHHSEIAYYISEGDLSEVEADRLNADSRIHGIAYVVVSYQTPIAWETKNGHVYKVQQKFTQTTSKHQGLLYLFHPRES